MESKHIAILCWLFHEILVYIIRVNRYERQWPKNGNRLNTGRCSSSWQKTARWIASIPEKPNTSEYQYSKQDLWNCILEDRHLNLWRISTSMYVYQRFNGNTENSCSIYKSAIKTNQNSVSIRKVNSTEILVIVLQLAYGCCTVNVVRVAIAVIYCFVAEISLTSKNWVFKPLPSFLSVNSLRIDSC